MTEKKRSGKLVVFEGLAGVGKTTLASELEKILPQAVFLREPGGTPFGEAMRRAVQGLIMAEYSIHPVAAFFAFSASRANLVHEVILPHLEEGKIVFLDRYWFSGFAYQGGGEGIDYDFIVAVSEVATSKLMPDAVLYLDFDIVGAMGRKEGCSDVDRYDRKELFFHEQVRDGYILLSEMYPDIWHTIDADKAKEEVLAEALEVLEEMGLLSC